MTDEEKAMHDYGQMMIKEYEERQRKTQEVLSEVKDIVPNEYYNSIKEWVSDEENGIWGDLVIVDEPLGEWREEGNYGYWETLKGMYIVQYVGYCGDDYSGTLTIKLTNGKFLQASFELQLESNFI